LEVQVFISVLLFKILEVIQLVLEADYLIFELDDFSFAIDQLALFILQIESFCVDELVQIVNSGKLLRDVVLESSSLGR
jgi:hypothetical protein